MNKKQQRLLQVEFICPGCGKSLAWALPSAVISCPRCGLWVTQSNRRKPQVEIFLPVDSDQTELF